MPAIAFYGGSFNPPTKAHTTIIDHLLKQTLFSKVVVKPCGTRKDKPELHQSPSQRKSRVIQQLQRQDPHYVLDLSAMDQPMIPTIKEWEKLNQSHSDHKIYFVAGTDLFVLEEDGKCQIQKWIEGQKLFEQASFYIYPRPVNGKISYPPHHILVDDFKPINISSSEIRRRESIKQT